MLQYCRDYLSPSKSQRFPTYAEEIAKLQVLQASPSLLSNASPKYNPHVLKFLDVVADVDFEIGLIDTQANLDNFVGASISLSTNFIGNDLIYMDDEVISEQTSPHFFSTSQSYFQSGEPLVMATFMFQTVLISFLPLNYNCNQSLLMVHPYPKPLHKTCTSYMFLREIRKNQYSCKNENKQQRIEEQKSLRSHEKREK